MSSVRTFLGVPLRRPLKEAILTMQGQLDPQIPAVRWIPPENLHLTLHFFGDVDEETLERIRVSVLSVKHCQQPFTVEVKGLGAFPSRQRPRILWLGLEPKDQLIQLHKSCQDQLRRAGVITELRSYFPHVTIGRLRQSKPALTVFARSDEQRLLGQLAVDRLVLYESRLHPGREEHIPLLTVSLDDEISNL